MASKSSSSQASKDGPLDLIFLWLAGMAESFGNIDQAFSIYNSLLKSNPRCITALSNRALIYFLKSQDDKAMADANKAVSIGKSDRVALRTRGLLYIFSGNIDAAQADYKKALESAEWDSLTAMFAYLVYMKAGDGPEAANTLNEAIDNKIKGKEWPYEILQFWRGDLYISDLMAMANSVKNRLLECRAYLGFSKALGQNPQEGKPDLQFVYTERTGTPLVRVLAVRGLKMIQAGYVDGLASKRERSDSIADMDFLG